MINLSDVISIHQVLVDKFGGSSGIRDHKALESAIARPFATFEKKDLYPSIIEKSAAILESILINHPFVDGNKRIGYVMMRILLLDGGLDIHATEDEKYDFVIQVSEGKLDIQNIIDWIRTKSEKINGY